MPTKVDCNFQSPCTLLLTSTVIFAASMSLTSLPMDLCREIMLRLDLASLFRFSQTNRYSRTVYMALSAKDIQGKINHFLLNDPQRENQCDPWGRCEEWNALYSVEEEYPHLLEKVNLLPCYACYGVCPSTNFGDWTAKRLTEIDDDGMPLQGFAMPIRTTNST